MLCLIFWTIPLPYKSLFTRFLHRLPVDKMANGLNIKSSTKWYVTSLVPRGAVRLLFRVSTYGLCVDMGRESKFLGFSGDINLHFMFSAL